MLISDLDLGRECFSLSQIFGILLTIGDIRVLAGGSQNFRTILAIAPHIPPPEAAGAGRGREGKLALPNSYLAMSPSL